jgi:hypothetical protein
VRTGRGRCGLVLFARWWRSFSWLCRGGATWWVASFLEPGQGFFLLSGNRYASTFPSPSSRRRSTTARSVKPEALFNSRRLVIPLGVHRRRCLPVSTGMPATWRAQAFTRLRRASHFPLLRQRKVTKGKATPASAQDGRSPSCSLRCSSTTGRQTTRPSLASNSLPFPGGRLRSSALLQGKGGQESDRTRSARRDGAVVVLLGTSLPPAKPASRSAFQQT